MSQPRIEWETLTRQLLNESHLFPVSVGGALNGSFGGVFSAKLKGVYAKALESHLRIHEQAQKATDKAEAASLKIRERSETAERINKLRESRKSTSDRGPGSPPRLVRTSGISRPALELSDREPEDGSE